MTSTNAIGLQSSNANQLAEKLNELLANYQMFYMNARGCHWNVKGPQFFELHNQFEVIYTDLLTKVDEIAERILTLGHTPLHAYSDYAKVSTVKEVVDVSDGDACVKTMVSGFSTLLEIQRSVLSAANDADDEGTASQVSDYIREQEKTVWMLSAYLGK
ncbi:MULTISPECIES: Dps family protein [Larsenimonas]|uniref:DNA starvation/stationary phase protection protein n=1 Tax=Larsenimonas suaedae TaxID=1851019 RepID=A0ABU1GUI6_9GAMM|nr:MULTISPECIES: Dps family protein [Larsenimonas]MCM2972156.1 DNA starvation/stationary phase protection protein [Larsenimonas suaedae]MCM5704287.1 DNA starvation/stationary phase protection protein [Larsenimonas salina]MDR5895048.1 DNA starvation/stationary phase protection protein [Larsenimonas suaedae]